MNVAEQSENLSPMLRQYLEFKQQYSDCILLFQVGDFYEAFFEDAVTIAEAINLTLTSRTKNAPDPVPMAGVPIPVIESYLERLLKLGFSIALVSQCESTETKSGIDRKLDRIVTPGITLQCDLEGDRAPIIAAVYPTSESVEAFSIAYSSVQTGEIFVREALDRGVLVAELSKLTPAEIIIPKEVSDQKFDKRSTWIRRLEENNRGAALKFRNPRYAELREGARMGALSGYAALGVHAKKAVRLLVDFVDETTVNVELPFQKVSIRDVSNIMSIDASARRTLELVQNSKDGDSAGTLFSVLNHTKTVGGARLLREWILNPSTEKGEILARQDAVRSFLNNKVESDQIRTVIKYISDFERIAARVELNIATPRELAALRDSLTQLPTLKNVLEHLATGENNSARLKEIAQGLTVSSELNDEILKDLIDAPPSHCKEGGIFKEGCNEELDHLRHIRKKGRSWIAELEAKERQITEIPSLKIRFNNVHGYFIEVTKTHLAKVPERYIKKQTTVNAERFITQDLKEMEQEVLSAESRQYDLERKMFEELRSKVTPYCLQLRAVYAKLCQLDVLLSFADVADLEGYVCPTIVEDNILDIENGKHPVVARLLKGSFIANSLSLSPTLQCVMLTGPNMGGKSTFLRQAGLITVMAQIGSFVSATRAIIGIVDKLFARMGASDDLLEGESTFMVEMREAAHIVTNASERSLLLIDEIGRGTATADGRAIARAILEWIIEKISCRTLFATHFHELTELDCYHSVVQNLSVGVVENGDDVLFTHEICKGPANRSYGLEVAKLAGLPQGLLERAKDLLHTSDDKIDCDRSKKQLVKRERETPSAQYELFPPTPVVKVVPPPDYQDLQKLATFLEDIDLNSMTPLDSLNLLAKLQKQAKEL